MGISKQELITMLEEEELKDAVLMVFANKQDLPNALATDAIADKLGLSLLKNRRARGDHFFTSARACFSSVLWRGPVRGIPSVVWARRRCHVRTSMCRRQWAIFKTSAIKGDGLYDGLDWLVNSLREGK